MIRVGTLIAILAALVGAGAARAATLQQVGLFDRPMFVTSDPADPDRLFVAEREGTIREVVPGATRTLADLGPEIGFYGKGQEGGLLSIAIAPDFAASGRLYVDFTSTANEIVVAEMRAGPGGAPLSSLRPLLRIPHPGETNHYGGQLQIGPEGLLYASTGDGGGSDDVHRNAQSLASLLGKVLRIDPSPGPVLPYTVPPGNPFAGGEAGDDPIWSLGLRNPYRFSFDRLTGAMLIGDVGQGEREEVDYQAPGVGGANYGWSCFEGTLPGPAGDPACAGPLAGVLTGPIFDYDHSAPTGASGCAIVGGYVVRDRALPELYGRYLYTDWCGGGLRSFDPAMPYASDRFEGLTVTGPTSFGEDACGRLYVAAESGRVSRLVGGGQSCAEAAARSTTYIGIRAQTRKVRKRKRAQITAWVSPCAGRRGQPVKLMRGRKHLGTRRLDQACTVRFRPKITRKAGFRALVGEDARYLAATSRVLRIKVLHRKAARRHHR